MAAGVLTVPALPPSHPLTAPCLIPPLPRCIAARSAPRCPPAPAVLVREDNRDGRRSSTARSSLGSPAASGPGSFQHRTHGWSGAPAAGRCLGRAESRGGRCAKGAAPQQSFHIPALAHGAWHEAHAVPAPSTSHVPRPLWHLSAAAAPAFLAAGGDGQASPAPFFLGVRGQVVLGSAVWLQPPQSLSQASIFQGAWLFCNNRQQR